MDHVTTEQDWQYMRRLEPELLDTLCQRINTETCAITKDKSASHHERYQRIHRHLKDADYVVGLCFNDWRRSTLHLRLMALRTNGLLTDEHLEHLSERVQVSLRALS